MLDLLPADVTIAYSERASRRLQSNDTWLAGTESLVVFCTGVVDSMMLPRA